MDIHHGKIEDLSKVETLDLLRRNHLGHLGCKNKSDLYVIPILYVFDDDFIYSHSKPGKKIDMLRESPSICLQVEEVSDLFNWKSGIVWGDFEELNGEQASFGMRLLVQKLISLRGLQNTPTLEIDFEAILETSIIYRFKIEKLSGRVETHNL